MMSFLGSIGQLMGGSGFEELLEEIYAPNIIHHILSGKAYARAVRGHLLVNTALLTMICNALISAGLMTDEDFKLLATVESVDAMDESIKRLKKKWSNGGTKRSAVRQ